MSSITVDPTVIEALADLLDRTGLSEIEIAEGEARIRVVRHLQPPAANTVAGVQAAPPATSGAPADRVPEGAIASPMVGTVYLAPEPGAPPYVTAGSRVDEGQTLLIVEAMKVMNPIRAPRAGTVSRILVTNAAPVEYGEPLLVLD
ncbi:MAG: biotin/lipoyl-containing protein [Pseudomonadota bacterium]